VKLKPSSRTLMAPETSRNQDVLGTRIFVEPETLWHQKPHRTRNLMAPGPTGDYIFLEPFWNPPE